MQSPKSTQPAEAAAAAAAAASHRRLVVLDMNGVLCCTDYDGCMYGPKSVHKLNADFKVRRKHVYVRPYVHTALSHLFANYNVAVWTSNGDAYANPIINACLGHHVKELQFLWTASECDTDSASGAITKNLDKIVAWSSGRYACKDIVLVDDSPEKKRGGTGTGLIIAKTYCPLHTQDNELLCLKSKVDAHFFDQERLLEQHTQQQQQ